MTCTRNIIRTRDLNLAQDWSTTRASASTSLTNCDGSTLASWSWVLSTPTSTPFPPASLPSILTATAFLTARKWLVSHKMMTSSVLRFILACEGVATGRYQRVRITTAHTPHRQACVHETLSEWRRTSGAESRQPLQSALPGNPTTAAARASSARAYSTIQGMSV